jgi:hypothetical protein
MLLYPLNELSIFQWFSLRAQEMRAGNSRVAAIP